jgi:hypothetical protein
MQFHREFFSLLEIAIDGDGGSTMVLISRLCKLRLRVVWTIWPRSSDLVTVFFFSKLLDMKLNPQMQQIKNGFL